MSNWKARLLVGFMLVAMMLATVAGPVLANDGKNGNGHNHFNHNNHFDHFNHFDHNNDFLVFNNDDDFDHFNHFNDFNDGFFFSPFTTFGFVNSCPFWGDFSGPVNQFDCFD